MPQYFGKLQTTEQLWSTIGPVQSINKTDSLPDSCASRTIHFNCGKTSLNIIVLAPNLIRVRMSPRGEFNSRSPEITLDDKQWNIIPFEVRETAEKSKLKQHKY